MLEYRWVIDFLEYDDFPEHRDDGALGLVEILDSRYVDNIASKTQFRNHPGKRLGPGINEGEVKHYRIDVDDHGTYYIICLGVVIKEITGDGAPEEFNSSELMRDPEGSA